MLINAIIIGVLLLIAGGIVFYLWRAKRRGEHCIGCPHAKSCHGKCGGSCNTAPEGKDKS